MVKLKPKKSLRSKVVKSKKSKPKLTKKTKVKEDNSCMSVEDFLNQDFEQNSDIDTETYEDNEQSFEPEVDEIESHKKSLEKLQETDPEFYKFLQENDKKLLKFDISDDEDEDGEDEENKVHVPSSDLEVASDESDFEAEDEEKVEDKRTITLKMLKKWQVDIQTDKSNHTIRNLVNAFHAALKRVSNNEEDDEPVHFKVGGNSSV